MSFALPSVKVKPELPDHFGFKEGSLGVQDVMTNGLASAKPCTDAVHALVASEMNVGILVPNKECLSCLNLTLSQYVYILVVLFSYASQVLIVQVNILGLPFMS
ncbi:unnamed protein product [Acanthoscelides obtectus]|uniref:Uncharacterized protein n=1 Tax=Acanthoscelides obtectus TaxID=200917 RepID=A0A9P0L268_ACAOB|nr:unnamed protein product [Acanthoscelides obtectus]CAK1661711.1 hypothetical protein AOBTE_LOCUS22746 [Acanthoscelides obtectus]